MKKILNDLEKARDVAINYLKFSDRTYKEVYTKLIDRQFNEEIAETVATELQEGGYINELNLAKNFILQKSKYANLGKRRIIYELAKKGVSKQNIAAAYNALLADDEINELDSAREALYKKTKGDPNWANEPKYKKKIYDFLLRRGFDYDIIRRLH